MSRQAEPAGTGGGGAPPGDAPWAPLERLLLRAGRGLLRPRLNRLRQYPPRALRLSPPRPARADPAGLPTLALVTPSYNQGAFIAATIESVLAQGYPGLRYVVQDGASDDGTRAVLERLGSEVEWRSEPDGGQADAINRGFARVTGEIMGWINSDDLLLPGALAHVGGFFRAHPDVDVVYGHRIVIDEQGREIGRWVLPRHDPRALAYTDYIPQETMFWRRAVWEAVGPLDASYHYAMDWDFALRAQRAGFRFRRLPRFLGCFRVHAEQKTTSRHDELTCEMARLRARHFGRPVSQREISRGVRAYVVRQIAWDWGYRLGWLRA
ncbi:MAG TPA: glycosyltransferase family 2 protein [Dongiaceae bacterium]|nr:glycosyltransferase family 2 protein [Dongiaceae bacterium]